MKTKQHKCVVCGARVAEPTFDTCDGTCRRAKAAGRTRWDEIKYEIIQAARQSRREFEQEQEQRVWLRRELEDRYMNQPYLAEAFA